MATNTVLQWQSHVTDSTDQETILGNLDFLENFAGAIMGDKSLSTNFNALRTKIKDGTLKPTEWTSSADFQTITTKLTNASSVKVKDIDGRLKVAEGSVEDHEEALKKKLDSKAFEDFKTTDYKTISDSVKSHGEALGEQAQTLAGQGERLNTAEKAIEKKLESSEFDKYKTSISGELGKYATSAALERLRAAMDKEVSHWTRDEHPNPIDDYKTLADLKTIPQPWEAGDDPERHIGDLCTVIGKTQTDKGVSYRFVKHDTADTYMWIKVVDNDGILALNAHNQFLVTYKERQDALDADAKETQKTIDAINKKLGGTKIDLDKLNKKAAEQQQHIEEMQAQYKVTVTTRGSIRNGEIVDGVPRNGYPAILHTAHVYGTDGKEISDTETLNKLVWTVNKGRTTAPQQFVVPGATCYVTEKDLVKSPDNPNYYDIELNSNF